MQEHESYMFSSLVISHYDDKNRFSCDFQNVPYWGWVERHVILLYLTCCEKMGVISPKKLIRL